MHTPDIPFGRYPGRVIAFGTYGLPSLRDWRPSRRTLIVGIFLAILSALVVTGTIDLQGAGAIALGAGPVASVDVREAAIAKLAEARAIAQPDGSIKAEDQDRYDAVWTEFTALDEEVKRTAQNEGRNERAQDRWAEYTGRVTGEPMRFSTVADTDRPGSLGEQFVASAAYKALRDSGALTSPNSKFRSDPVIAAPHLTRIGAAASDIVRTGSGGGATALVQPYRPGIILPYGQPDLVVRDLFANENMPSGDTIEYAAQVGFDNAAAAVAQATSAADAGALKPQSSVAWEPRSSKAEWIATWMAATRQALADENQLRGLIDNQGRLMIRIEEDDQLLNGDGTTPNLSGIRDQASLQLLDLTGFDNLDGIRTARRLVKHGTSRLPATFIVVNPIDGEEFDLLKNDIGDYRAGNPIGNGQGDGTNPPTIWRLARVESEAMPEGKALVGARAGATVYERQPITVLTADQHADFFVRNLVVILFEERLAFPVYFPTAFVEVTLSEWVG